eukprot:scaffold26588_cov69-Phaeocystis_antarctica.AAC.5
MRQYPRALVASAAVAGVARDAAVALHTRTQPLRSIVLEQRLPSACAVRLRRPDWACPEAKPATVRGGRRTAARAHQAPSPWTAVCQQGALTHQTRPRVELERQLSARSVGTWGRAALPWVGGSR